MVAVFVVTTAAIALFFMTNSSQPVAQQTAASETPAQIVSDMAEKAELDSGTIDATIDVETALSERGLGDPKAPVTIREFASLTCGHCADFHKETFKDLKEQYIDTGKVYFIFTDFPLNKPALDASMAARCLPEGRYFNFIKLLFQSQENWAFSPDYLKSLKQTAQLAGLSADKFDACLASQPLQDGLLERMKQAQEKHEIKSTPSFVIDNETTISGVQSVKEFAKIIDPKITP